MMIFPFLWQQEIFGFSRKQDGFNSYMDKHHLLFRWRVSPTQATHIATQGQRIAIHFKADGIHWAS
jgi:hypothetical protein